MKKTLICALMALVAFTICSCGNDDEGGEPKKPQEQNGQQGGQGGSSNSSALLSKLKNTKWMGVAELMEPVTFSSYDKNYNLIKRVDTIATRDTIYFDFGVDVSYPTYTKKVYDRTTNQRYNQIEMWFDSFTKDDTLRLAFRSFPPGDPGFRDVFGNGTDKIFTTEHKQQVELRRIK